MEQKKASRDPPFGIYYNIDWELDFEVIPELWIDRTGERTLVDGVRGGGGGLEDDEAATAVWIFRSPSGRAIARVSADLALSCAKASQNALWVMKLSLL